VVRFTIGNSIGFLLGFVLPLVAQFGQIMHEGLVVRNKESPNLATGTELTVAWCD